MYGDCGHRPLYLQAEKKDLNRIEKWTAWLVCNTGKRGWSVNRLRMETGGPGGSRGCSNWQTPSQIEGAIPTRLQGRVTAGGVLVSLNVPCQVSVPGAAYAHK